MKRLGEGNLDGASAIHDWISPLQAGGLNAQTQRTDTIKGQHKQRGRTRYWLDAVRLDNRLKVRSNSCVTYTDGFYEKFRWKQRTAEFRLVSVNN